MLCDFLVKITSQFKHFEFEQFSLRMCAFHSYLIVLLIVFRPQKVRNMQSNSVGYFRDEFVNKLVSQISQLQTCNGREKLDYKNLFLLTKVTPFQSYPRFTIFISTIIRARKCSCGGNFGQLLGSQLSGKFSCLVVAQ